MGIEPTQPAWKAGALPLSYTRVSSCIVPVLLPAPLLLKVTMGRELARSGSALPFSRRFSRRFRTRVSDWSNLPCRLRQHGWSRIRTCEGSATRFTVWPLWPLGYPPVSGFAVDQPDLVSRSRATRRRTPVSFDRAGGETRTHNLRFTKPLLCQLSYASNQGRETTYYIVCVNECKRFPRPTRRTPIGARSHPTDTPGDPARGDG
jgi:hypothetical protein